MAAKVSAHAIPVGMSPDAENGFGKDWPAQEPEMPRKGRYFCCGRTCGCCPAYVLLLPAFGLAAYVLGLVLLVAIAAAAITIWATCGCMIGTALSYFKQWKCSPWFFPDELYLKLMFFGYQYQLMGHMAPGTGPNDMPVDKLRPKGKLQKAELAYTLNLKVPLVSEEDFKPVGTGLSLTERFKSILPRLPTWDDFRTFEDDEDPVAYVMRQMSSIYPTILQDWADKRSDKALARFCMYGIGAHRIESVIEDGQRLFLVRTNALSGLPVREGFARYGGDVYFDAGWRPVKIVDAGLGPLPEESPGVPVVTRPGEPGWEEAKFRFRSSLSVLVTLVDHLFGIHLQAANLIVTAVREQLSPEHPIRRFLVPFMYGTITVNHDAYTNLAHPGAMAPRCFAFTDAGMRLAFRAAPKLLMSGYEVSPADGGPIVNRAKYVEYLKGKRGIDTEYHRQTAKFWLVCRRFVEDYLAYYYPSVDEVACDPELVAMCAQLAYQLDTVLPPIGLNKVDRSPGECLGAEMYEKMVDVITNFVYLVTAGHEQAGAVQAYVQDVSFCAFKWVPGKVVGTRQTATAQALLMSFTSAPMPKLLGSDWTHLFPASTKKPQPGAKTPQQSFADFQAALTELSKAADAYNDAAPSRPFPECYPLYVVNPSSLETSVSV